MPEFPSSLQQQARTRGYQNEKAMLHDMYVNQGRTLEQLAEELCTSYTTIQRRLTDHQIPRRKRNQPRKKAK
jgi:transcriptional regulator of acetoin/glycerol metabolism